ncbi:hypothetical protein MN608_02678 [Microdochium nivale]|nr:hypothetical protein MN608_02678 [Microdochium nivale]
MPLRTHYHPVQLSSQRHRASPASKHTDPFLLTYLGVADDNGLIRPDGPLTLTLRHTNILLAKDGSYFTTPSPCKPSQQDEDRRRFSLRVVRGGAFRSPALVKFVFGRSSVRQSMESSAGSMPGSTFKGSKDLRYARVPGLKSRVEVDGQAITATIKQP